MMILTDRQAEVLEMVCQGYSNEQISERTGLAMGTIKVHVHNLLKAFEADNRVRLTVAAIKTGNFDIYATEPKRKP